MCTPWGRTASLDDPPHKRPYDDMQRARRHFDGYEAGFVTLKDDPVLELTKALAALEADCWPITLFAGVLLLPADFPGPGRALGHEPGRGRVPRSMSAGSARQPGGLSGGWSSPQNLIDETREREMTLRGEIPEEVLDPVGAWPPDAGGERA